MNTIIQRITVIILVVTYLHILFSILFNVYISILQLMYIMWSFLSLQHLCKKNTYRLYFSKLVSLFCRTICVQREHIVLIFVVTIVLINLYVSKNNYLQITSINSTYLVFDCSIDFDSLLIKRGLMND